VILKRAAKVKKAVVNPQFDKKYVIPDRITNSAE